MFENIHHKGIKRFSLEGTISDEAFIPRLKIKYIQIVEADMRGAGYVPRLDIDPDFTIGYNSNTENFTFNLSLYGTYVGKSKSEWIIGIDGTQVIATQKNRLKGSLSDQESQSNLK